MGRVQAVGRRGPVLTEVFRFLSSPAFVRSIMSSAIFGVVALSFCVLQSPSAGADGVTTTTPTLTTTVITPMETTVGNSWNDTATVTGNAAGGAPTGSVAFTLCQETEPSTPCTGGTPVGTVSTPTSMGDVSTFTLPAADAQTPTSVGTYCYNAAYTASSGGSYSSVWQQSDSECFTVCPPTTTTPTLTTTVITPMETTVGNSWNDTATVTGNAAGGAPTGSVAFTLCQETEPSTPCTGGTPVGTVSTPTSMGDVSTFTLPAADAQTPTSVGTYCYNAAYTASSGGSYSSVWQQSDSECFTVCPPTTTTPTLTTTVITPMETTVGNSWNDTATVTGNAAGGAPTGSVAFTLCQETEPSTPCTGGTPVGTVSTPTSMGDVSTFTLPAADAQTPTSVGTYCYNAAYTASSGGSYSSVWQQSDSECFTVCPPTTTTPTLTTTVITPMETTVGNSWNDTATVTGNAAGGAPTGSVAFTLCQETEPSTPCTGGTPVGTVSTPTSMGDVSTFTLPAADAQTPTSVGTYCYNAAYTASSGGSYSSVWQQSDSECFSVTPAPSVTTTQQSTSASGSGSIALGGSVTDTATVTGNATGGAPTGTVTFLVCGPAASPSQCGGGTQLGAPQALSVSSGDSSSATSTSFTPTAAGSYCFAALYRPDGTANYTSSTDLGGPDQADECFVVTVVVTGVSSSTPSPTPTSTMTPPSVPVGKLAVTGANLSVLLASGLGFLGLGGFLVLVPGRRSRKPSR